MYFRYFVIIAHWKRVWPFTWRTWIPFTKRCIVLSLVEIAPAVLEKKIFQILLMHFRYFVIISPWKTTGPFIWTELTSLCPRMLCDKFGWNWRAVVLEKRMKMWKVYDDENNDNGQILLDKLTWAKAQVS